MAPRTWFTPRQKEFLEVVAQEKSFAANFYLTGGTALSAVYYHHRDSEDLDFFSPQEFTSHEMLELLFRTQKSLKWQRISRRKGGGDNLYILTWKNGETLNVDFVHYYPSMFPGKTVMGIAIDSVRDIAINKIETIHNRHKARDYVDLYIIMQKERLTASQLLKWHQQKMELTTNPLDLAAKFLLAKEIASFPRMRIPFSRQKMITFFESLAKSLEPEIFT